MNHLETLFDTLHAARVIIDDAWADLADVLLLAGDDEAFDQDADVDDRETFITELDQAYQEEMFPFEAARKNIGDPDTEPQALLEAWNACLRAELQLMIAKCSSPDAPATGPLEVSYILVASAWNDLADCIDAPVPFECPEHFRPFVLLERLRATTEDLAVARAEAGLTRVRDGYEWLARNASNSFLKSVLYREASALLDRDREHASRLMQRFAAKRASDDLFAESITELQHACDDPPSKRPATRIAAMLDLAHLMAHEDTQLSSNLLKRAAAALQELPDPDPGLRALQAFAESEISVVEPLPSTEIVTTGIREMREQIYALTDEAVDRSALGRVAAALPMYKEAYDLALAYRDDAIIATAAANLADALAIRADHEMAAVIVGIGAHGEPHEPSSAATGALLDARLIALRSALASADQDDHRATFEAISRAVEFSDRLAEINPTEALDVTAFQELADRFRSGHASTWRALLYAHLADLYDDGLPHSPLGRLHGERAVDEFIATGGGPELIAVTRDEIEIEWEPVFASKLRNYLEGCEQYYSSQRSLHDVRLYDKLLMATWFGAIAELATEQVRPTSARTTIRSDSGDAGASREELFSLIGQSQLIHGELFGGLGRPAVARRRIIEARGAYRMANDVLNEMLCSSRFKSLGRGPEAQGPGHSRDDFGPER